MSDIRKVLIVDDQPDSAGTFSAILSGAGYEVYEAGNADMALDLIQRDDISAIITDPQMQCGDGRQLFEYVTENHPDIPVILLTASRTDEHALSLMTRGAFCCFNSRRLSLS
jgi:DNA-binding NtrC family response regulator